MRTVKFTIKTDKETAKVSEMTAPLEIPESHDEMIQWTGAEKTYQGALAKFVILFQDRIRQAMGKGLLPEEILKLVPRTWKPTMSIRIVGMREITQEQAFDKAVESDDPMRDLVSAYAKREGISFEAAKEALLGTFNK